MAHIAETVRNHSRIRTSAEIAFAMAVLQACGSAPAVTSEPTKNPTLAPIVTPTPTVEVTPMPTPFATPTEIPTPTGTVLVTLPPSPSEAPIATPTAPVITEAPLPSPSPEAFPNTASGFLDKALFDADPANGGSGTPNITGAELTKSVDDAIKSNLSDLPAGYPTSVSQVSQVKDCVTGTMAGVPSQDKDLARSLSCADTAIFAWMGWNFLPPGSPNRELFRTAFNNAVYFLENNASKTYVDQGFTRIRTANPS